MTGGFSFGETVKTAGQDVVRGQKMPFRRNGPFSGTAPTCERSP
jgi:hypothetical protein